MAESAPLVMKFGGTSVGKAMDRVVSIVLETQQRFPRLVVVTSALTQVTNKLLGQAAAAASGQLDGLDELCGAILEQHRAVAAQLDIPELLAGPALERVSGLLEHFGQLCRAMSVLRELSPRGLDAVAALGERMALPLLCAALEAAGLPVEPVDASELIVTTAQVRSAEWHQRDAQVGESTPLMQLTEAKTVARLQPLLDAGKLPVVTGFVAAAEDGTTTTLGRGGSDYSAALLAACLRACEVWIWTDVTGIMSADPRVAADAVTIPQLSLREVAELAYFGAKVLHPKTIRPVVDSNIPLRICNTFAPEQEGTWVKGDGTGCQRARSFENLPMLGQLPGCIKAVTAMKQMALVTLAGRGMLGMAGLSARLFDTVHKTGTSVSLITQASSEQSICLAVPSGAADTVVKALRRSFEQEMEQRDIESVAATQPVSVITVVGAEMCNQIGVAGKVFQAIGQAKVNVMAIAQGSSEVSISMVVLEEDTTAATVALHNLTKSDS